MREAESAFVEMNAVFEAVMCAIRGESLSDFALSHGAVYEANMLREAKEALSRLLIIERTARERAEARVKALEENIIEWHSRAAVDRHNQAVREIGNHISMFRLEMAVEIGALSKEEYQSVCKTINDAHESLHVAAATPKES